MSGALSYQQAAADLLAEQNVGRFAGLLEQLASDAEQFERGLGETQVLAQAMEGLYLQAGMAILRHVEDPAGLCRGLAEQVKDYKTDIMAPVLTEAREGRLINPEVPAQENARRIGFLYFNVVAMKSFVNAARNG